MSPPSLLSLHYEYVAHSLRNLCLHPRRCTAVLGDDWGRGPSRLYLEPSIRGQDNNDDGFVHLLFSIVEVSQAILGSCKYSPRGGAGEDNPCSSVLY
jgi:hypothetical protein